MKNLIIFFTTAIMVFDSCTWNKSPFDCDTLIPCDPVITISPNPQDTCFDYNMDFYDLPQIYYPAGFGSPYYNPLSIYEFIYTLSSSNNGDPSDSKTVNVNLCDGSESLITPFPYGDIHQFKWSKKDWLLFGYPGSIYLMKSNGDSLHLLNDLVGANSLLYSGTWIGDENRIQCKIGSANGLNVIMDMTGFILDTIPYSFGLSSCFGNILAVMRYEGGQFIVSTINLNDYVLTDLTPISYLSGFLYVPTAMEWLNEDEIIWCDNYGIFKTSIYSNEVTAIKLGCNSLIYSDLSVSPAYNGDFLVQRNKTWVNNDTAYHKTEILKINAYTGEEWIVNLEQ